MDSQVIIAGGGPVGLFLACELGLAGVSVIVLEQLPDPHTELKAGWMGMRHINVASIEAFYRRGLLDAVRSTALAGFNAKGKPGVELRGAGSATSERPRHFVGHFAGIMLDGSKVDFSQNPYLFEGPSATGGVIGLEGLERVLEARARELGVDVRRGVQVTGFQQNADSVTVDAGQTSLRAQWLLGCDGGHSTVRKIADFDFAGTDAELTGYSAWVDIADPEKLQPGFNLTDAGMYVNGPGPGRIGVIDFDGAAFDRSQTITLDTLQALLRKNSQTDVTLTALHVATSYTDRARQATTYRKDRVLLAGDAAHIHSPLGGQGMNTGIGDAINLGWKLAAVIHGRAPGELLDTYTSERHPAGAWTLDWTRAQVEIIRPNPHSRALARIIRDLINTRDGATYFISKITGLALQYDLPGDHPLIGRTAPDLEFDDGTRLGALLHDARPLLLDLTGSDRLTALGDQDKAHVKFLSSTPKDSRGLTALLVRPDGFVAWATDDEVDAQAATSALKAMHRKDC